MADLDQLPFLLQLLDEPDVRAAATVRDALASFGPELACALEELPEPPSDAVRKTLNERLATERRAWTTDAWRDRPTGGDFAEELEAGLDILSRHLSGFLHPGSLVPALDALAADMRQATVARAGSSGTIAGTELAMAMFGPFGRFHGGGAETYRPEHSNLRAIFAGGEGLPIALASLFLLVADRLDIFAAGCNLPGHFLAITENASGDRVLIDCHGGTVLDEDAFDQADKPDDAQIAYADLLGFEVDAAGILRRTLHNLAATWQQVGDRDETNLMVYLLDRLDWGRATPPINPSEEDAAGREAISPLTIVRRPPGERVNVEPQFTEGAVVRHLQYGYRGLIASVDKTCQADELWYRANEFQPAREQPWYHVLVDGTGAITYAAQSSLEPWPTGAIPPATVRTGASGRASAVDVPSGSSEAANAEPTGSASSGPDPSSAPEPGHAVDENSTARTDPTEADASGPRSADPATRPQAAPPIRHPLLHSFFFEPSPGQFVRNERPWPREHPTQ